MSALVRYALFAAWLLPSIANAEQGPARFALVIGNNQPETKSKATMLRFADDDALATAELLRQAKVQVITLATPDATTRGLMPHARIDGRPTVANLTAAVAKLRARMEDARRRGNAVEFLLFYSGHGDVARGEGYVLLEDKRLTRTLLFSAILDKLPSTRNHVLVDACKSFFLAQQKGPGGRRVRYRGSFAQSSASPAQERTGFVLSTSSARDSHEWERFQAGIFSHEVRSALRGGADANLDGAITYKELAAFLSRSNASIKNPRFRPRFAVIPPGRKRASFEHHVLSWSESTRALLIDRPGHIYIEDTSGNRIVDVHADKAQSLRLQLPARRPLFVRLGGKELELTKRNAERPLSSLTLRSPRIASRGAVHVAFEQLFSLPFSAAFVSEYCRRFCHIAAEQTLRSTRRELEPEPVDYLTQHEFGATLGYLPLDAFTESVSVGANYTFHMNRFWAIDARFHYVHSIARGLRTELQSSFGATSQEFVKMRYYGEVGALFKPLSVQFRVTDNWHILGELYISASFVAAKLEGGPRQEAAPFGQGDHVGIGAAPGLGFRWLLGKRVAFRVDARQMLLYATGHNAGEFPLTLTMGLNLVFGD